MTTGLYRVYWRDISGARPSKKWIFEAGFVYKEDALSWVKMELNGYDPDLEYKIMHNGQKIWCND